MANMDKPNQMAYDMSETMIEKVKGAIFQHEGKQEDDRSSFYEVVYATLIDWWTKSCTPLHCMAHSLNLK